MKMKKGGGGRSFFYVGPPLFVDSGGDGGD